MGLYTLMKFARFALFSAPSASWASVFGVNLHNYGRVVWPAIYTCSCTKKEDFTRNNGVSSVDERNRIRSGNKAKLVCYGAVPHFSQAVSISCSPRVFWPFAKPKSGRQRGETGAHRSPVRANI